MRNFLSILLITLLLLNTMGYYGLFIGMEYTHDARMTEMLDAGDYGNSDEVTIKLPISVPYMPDNQDFVRVDGKFQHGGEVYRMVKQKYERDTLTIICVKDNEGKKIQNALASYLKTFTEKPAGHPSSAKLVASFSKDFIHTSVELTSSSRGWQNEFILNDSPAELTDTFVSSIIQPPEII